MLGAVRRAAPAERRIWTALAVSMGCWLIGQLVWESYDVFGHVAPVPSIADLVWLAVPAIAAFGLYRLAPAPGRIRILLDLDAVMLAITVGALVLAAEWTTILHSSLPIAGRTTAIAYPMAYTAAVAVALGAIFGSPAVLRHKDMLLVFSGLALEGFAFAGWARELLDGTYVAGASWLDPIFTVGLLSLGAGALIAHTGPAPRLDEIRRLQRRTIVTAAGFLSLVAALGYLALSDVALTPRLVLVGALAANGLLIFPRNWFAFGVVEELERERREVLARRANELEAFAYSASHDLKAPLVSIEGFAGMLERSLADELNDRDRHHLARIRANADSMQQLIDDLFAFARSGSDERTAVAVDTTELATQLVEEWRDRALAAGIPLSVDGPLPSVRAHPVRLKQALTNLIDNALRYGGGEVRLSGRMNGDWAEILVEDAGDGVPAGERAAIFDAFARGRGAAAGAPDGTGLGLALVKRNVEASGGDVRYEHAPGARFVLSFPAGPA
jgi:signal transduction histidine kinase